MNPSNFIRAKGSVSITLRSNCGKIKQSITVPNLVVDVGKHHIASRLVSDAPFIMSHMAVGIDDTPSIPTDNELGNEIRRVKLESFVAVDNSVVATAIYGSGSCDGALVEAGIFNDDIEGDMLCRTTFETVYKELNDSLTVVWAIEFITTETY